jgi:hypothetical protein
MEITIIFKRAGPGFWTAAAFVGKAYAACSTAPDRATAAAKARALAEQLVRTGQLTPLDPTAARLGGRAKVPHFSMCVSLSKPHALVQGAQLLALNLPHVGAEAAA